MAESEKQNTSSCLTINGTQYRTSGNILFSDSDEDRYYVAESPMLEKLDQAIQNGILGNGMRSLLKSLR